MFAKVLLLPKPNYIFIFNLAKQKHSSSAYGKIFLTLQLSLKSPQSGGGCGAVAGLGRHRSCFCNASLSVSCLTQVWCWGRKTGVPQLRDSREIVLSPATSEAQLEAGPTPLWLPTMFAQLWLPGLYQISTFSLSSAQSFSCLEPGTSLYHTESSPRPSFCPGVTLQHESTTCAHLKSCLPTGATYPD